MLRRKTTTRVKAHRRRAPRKRVKTNKTPSPPKRRVSKPRKR